MNIGIRTIVNRAIYISLCLLVLGLYACSKSEEGGNDNTDSDGDGVTDLLESERGSNPSNPCDPLQSPGYSGFDSANTVWQNADCDGDGISNGNELGAGSNPYQNELANTDSDGDGLSDFEELNIGSDENNPCDPAQEAGYSSFDSFNPAWAAADCDGDGLINSEELIQSRDPYFNELSVLDTDGDGLTDLEEISANTDETDPCDPMHETGYANFDPANATWGAADCDGDGIINEDELLLDSDPYEDDRVFVIPQFLPSLSELKLFGGQLSDLKFQNTVFTYELSTPLFTDYAQKLRSIALPKDGQISYNGEGLLVFPNNTVISKTFYYFIDERQPSLGKKIIETRILIKQNGLWMVGNYIWNSSQTEAFLDSNSQVVAVDWIDELGVTRSVNYRIPGQSDCFQCHNINGQTKLIGPKARALNFVVDGIDQIQALTDLGVLTGAPPASNIVSLPVWSDISFSLEERARAYLDMNCAHCHQPGGSRGSAVVDLRYETPYGSTGIFDNRFDIQDRMNSGIPNYSMPYIGTSLKHTEGIDLIEQYINSLD